MNHIIKAIIKAITYGVTMDINFRNTILDCNALEQRILCNEENQSLNLVTWIFDRLNILENDHILELCCGTGKQTSEFIKKIGENGRILAIDLSEEALAVNAKNIPDSKKSNVHLIKSRMEDILRISDEYGMCHFDICFCAYGLYYSEDPRKLLDDLKKLINIPGRIVIVGPHGKNNSPLYEFLEKQGVVISDFIKFSGQTFMVNTIIPWAIDNSNKFIVNTAMNKIIWKKPDDFLNYCKNSSLLDENKFPKVNEAIANHFSQNKYFLNYKNIMMIEIFFD